MDLYDPHSPSSHMDFLAYTMDPSQELAGIPHPAELQPDVFPFPARSRPQGGPTSVEAMREMIFRIAAMQPVHIDPESVKPPKRRNVRISSDPQSVAARHRRERISERIRILQRMVPGGTKMDTASMLDEAIHYVKFLKTQVQSLEMAAATGCHQGYGDPSNRAQVYCTGMYDNGGGHDGSSNGDGQYQRYQPPEQHMSYQHIMF